MKLANAALFSIVLAAAAMSCRPGDQLQTPGGLAPSSHPTAAIYNRWPFDAKEAARRQGETAKALGIPVEMALEFSENHSLKLRLVPAGRFIMGSSREQQEQATQLPAGRPSYFPDIASTELQHEVTITKPFYMGVCHVTKGQFSKFVLETGYKTLAEKRGCVWDWKYDTTLTGWSEFSKTKWDEIQGSCWRHVYFPQPSDHPVVCIAYEDAIAFCGWLSKKSGMAVTLPTEAQWECACRAGTATAYIWGDDVAAGAGWCDGADEEGQGMFDDWLVVPWNDGYVATSPVGRFKPNAFGLYDMCGNAWQWCLDWYGSDYHSHSPSSDPGGPASGEERCVRGGAYNSLPAYLRSANCGCDKPDRCDSTIGFRIVVNVPAR